MRFRENPALATALTGPAVTMPSWGERNYVTWPEVETWSIGDFGTTAART